MCVVFRFPLNQWLALWVEPLDQQLQFLAQGCDFNALDERRAFRDFIVFRVVFLDIIDFMLGQRGGKFRKIAPSMRTSQTANVTTMATDGVVLNHFQTRIGHGDGIPRGGANIKHDGELGRFRQFVASRRAMWKNLIFSHFHKLVS